MCTNWNAFTNYVHNRFTIYLGDSTPANVKEKKHVKMQLQGSISITFTNVLNVSFLTTNLLSVFALLNKGCRVHFEKKQCFNVFHHIESHTT